MYTVLYKSKIYTNLQAIFLKFGQQPNHYKKEPTIYNCFIPKILKKKLWTYWYYCSELLTIVKLNFYSLIITFYLVIRASIFIFDKRNHLPGIY